jgi:hypothetical protein
MSLNNYDIYQVTIDVLRDYPLTKRVDIVFPSTFQRLHQKCASVTANKCPVSCISDCSSEVCTNSVSVTNFSDATTPGDDIVIKIGAMSPVAAGTPAVFKVYLYATNTNLVVLTSALTFTSKTFPYDFWFEWLTTDLYTREVRAALERFT